MVQYTAKHGIISLLALLLLSQSDTVLSESNSTVTSPDSTDQYGYTNVTPSMAVIVIVIVAALFLTGFFSVYLRHCYSDSSSSVLPTFRSTAGRSRRGAIGLEAQVIESFPMLQYSEVKDHKIGKSALECAVCLNEFEDDETLRLIPKCDHVFHPECIDVWLSSHVTCPVCRANLTPQPGENTAAESTHPQAESTHPVAESTHPESAHGEEEKQESHDVEAGFDRKTTWGMGWYPRSHSTGHSLVRPGQNTDRFTLRLPEEVRQRIMSRHLDRSMSMVVLPRERSSRRGYRGGDGSSRGKYRQMEKLGGPGARSDRWVFGRNPSFLTRASSFLTRASSSIRRPKVAGNDGAESSTRSVGLEVSEPARPPV